MKNRDKPLDLDALLGAWPSAQHAAVPAGFADRVLAACDLQPAPIRVVAAARRPSPRGAWLAAAALAAAFVLIPLFVYRTARSQAPDTVAAAVAPDLGLERD